jgi:hypothetical protein
MCIPMFSTFTAGGAAASSGKEEGTEASGTDVSTLADGGDGTEVETAGATPSGAG